MNVDPGRPRPIGNGRSRRPRRKNRRGDLESIVDTLGAVIDRLGGALCADEPRSPLLSEVIDPELAERTEISYRDGELLVVAATNADATLLSFEKSTIARWALEVYSLGTEPRVRVAVGRGSR